MPSTLPADLRLDPLTEADFGLLTSLAAEIWRAHYVKIISLAQVDYMLADRYTPEKLRAYLGSGQRWLELLRLDGEALGYCSYALLPEAGELKLEQLYLRPSQHGRGLGGFMLRHVEARARELGRDTIVLAVNKANVDSIAVYRRSGFSVRKEILTQIGGGFVMDDYIMEKKL